MDSVKLLVGGSGGGGGGFGEAASARAMGIDSDGCLPSLTLKQRVTGCVVCFGAGMLVSMCSTLSITNPVHFGILYTVGNLLSLTSTTLLFGPMRQIRNMFHRKRVVATLMYLAALVGTLAVALEVRRDVVQWRAAWGAGRVCGGLAGGRMMSPRGGRGEAHTASSLHTPTNPCRLPVQTSNVWLTLLMILVQFCCLVWCVSPAASAVTWGGRGGR
jgi:hypothetical protein